MTHPTVEVVPQHCFPHRLIVLPRCTWQMETACRVQTMAQEAGRN